MHCQLGVPRALTARADSPHCPTQPDNRHIGRSRSARSPFWQAPAGCGAPDQAAPAAGTPTLLLYLCWKPHTASPPAPTLQGQAAGGRVVR
jgi:hypothetical protein